LHTSNQEASTGWAGPKINDTKIIIYLYIYNKYEFTGIFFSKLKIQTVFLERYSPFANGAFY